MRHRLLYRAVGGLLLGVALLLLGRGSSQAACGPGNLSDYCSATYGLAGDLSALVDRPSKPGETYPAVAIGQLPMAGALTYSDFTALEAEARRLLECNMQFRQSISPYQTTGSKFDELVRKFDNAGGWDAAVLPTPGNCTPNATTLHERINQADAELRLARDYYAFLAVYADVPRFRSDAAYTGPGLCGATDKENPNPKSDPNKPEVLPPVIDWCNFHARLRQSVREAAYLRMIFGQEFVVDALGLHFSAGQLLGGEAFVRDELAKLEAAVYQYGLAEKGMNEALNTLVGNGCYLANFYTQAEWSLLIRAVTGKERAQHEIAIRKSYLDDYGATPEQRAAASVMTFRAATMEQYVKMVATAGQMANPAPCIMVSGGQLPDGSAIAEMVQNMLDTRATVKHLGDGRNPFGFDVRFTPATPYGQPGNPNDPAGLWNQAQAAAVLAQQIQARTEQAERNYDLNQVELLKAVAGVKTNVDRILFDVVSCDSNTLADAELEACVNTQIELTTDCDSASADFNACINNPDIFTGGDLRKLREEMRAAYLEIVKIQTQIENNAKRRAAEISRSTTIKSALLTNSNTQAAYAVGEAMSDFFSFSIGVGTDFGSGALNFNPGAIAKAVLGNLSIKRQAVADMEIEGAESEANVRNLFLDLVELQGDLAIAAQQYIALETEYDGLAAVAEKALLEALRQRNYIQQSPANDPGYRIVRDSLRLQLASQLQRAARLSYLAAKRAEYEYAARLSASTFAVSDIYRARTADDILFYLNALRAVTDNLVNTEAAVNPSDFTISVAQHVLGLTDEALGLTGQAAEAERTRRFRLWVADHTYAGGSGKPQLVFNFTTSAAANGIFSNVIQQGFDRYWLHKLAGVGVPKPGNTGVGVNLVSAQAGNLGYRTVALNQGGSVHLRTLAGCIFDYRLIPPAVLLGLEWPSNQPPESTGAVFKGHVNGANGERTSAFLGRAVSATDWQVIVFAGSPQAGLPDLDLQQLTDIELHFSTTYASRNPGAPNPANCARIDF
ncbi:MAG: hypothetical protein KJZ93_12055 [Caldilineaceae bacterium]|nr:hypothetical protein [Caldilineaceae bacterium]